MYRRQLLAHGETVTLRRVNASPAAPTEHQVRARVTGYQPEELVGGIQVGDRKVIVLAEDVPSGFLPFLLGGREKIVVRGKALNVERVDDSTRRVGGELIAYEMQVRG
jgi:hypothetical protein